MTTIRVYRCVECEEHEITIPEYQTTASMTHELCPVCGELTDYEFVRKKR